LSSSSAGHSIEQCLAQQRTISLRKLERSFSTLEIIYGRRQPVTE
jgi:hypothetical protein